jgi:enoyl-CoA hydratase
LFGRPKIVTWAKAIFALLMSPVLNKMGRAKMRMVRLEVNERIAIVTMDHPPVNTQPPALMAEMMETFDSLSDRDDVGAVILTGAGKCFSAGADLKSRPGADAPPGTMWQRMRMARECMYSVLECSKPVIAAINGPAIGAGFGVAVCADILVMSENAFMSLPEIDVGLMGGARHAMRSFPISLARRMVLTGYRATAQELYRRGVIEACLPPAALMPYCLQMAAELAAKSPLAMAMAKEALVVVEGMTLRDGYRYEQGNTVRLSKTEDAVEARTAVLEKRIPVFKRR